AGRDIDGKKVEAAVVFRTLQRKPHASFRLLGRADEFGDTARELSVQGGQSLACVNNSERSRGMRRLDLDPGRKGRLVRAVEINGNPVAGYLRSVLGPERLE